MEAAGPVGEEEEARSEEEARAAAARGEEEKDRLVVDQREVVDRREAVDRVEEEAAAALEAPPVARAAKARMGCQRTIRVWTFVVRARHLCRWRRCTPASTR